MAPRGGAGSVRRPSEYPRGPHGAATRRRNVEDPRRESRARRAGSRRHARRRLALAGCPAVYPRSGRGGAATRPTDYERGGRGRAATRPTDYPRSGRGGAATRPRTIHEAAAAERRPTSRRRARPSDRPLPEASGRLAARRGASASDARETPARKSAKPMIVAILVICRSRPASEIKWRSDPDGLGATWPGGGGGGGGARRGGGFFAAASRAASRGRAAPRRQGVLSSRPARAAGPRRAVAAVARRRICNGRIVSSP